VLTDVFDGLVAAGTLALAGVTYRLGRATSRSVQEAYRARIDESAHRVMPHGFTVATKCVNPRVAANTDPYQFDPGTTWSLAQHGGTHIGLWSYLSFRNEGGVSALLRFALPEGVELWEPVGDEGLAVSAPERQNEDWLVLLPGTDSEVRFIWWQAADRWALAADEGDVPCATLVATISDATGGARDECELTFGAQVLWRHPTEDGWIVAARDMRHTIPDPPGPPVVRVGQLVRSYPGEPTHRIWRGPWHPQN
jgi:hypothetical protein